LEEWHCNSFPDVIDEMKLWDWNVPNKDFWWRLAKSLPQSKSQPREQNTWTKNLLQCSSLENKLGTGNTVHSEVQNMN